MTDSEKTRFDELAKLGFSEETIRKWEGERNGGKRKKHVTAGAVLEKAGRLENLGFQTPIKMFVINPQIYDLSIKEIKSFIQKMTKSGIGDPIDAMELFPEILGQPREDLEWILRYGQKLEGMFGIDVVSMLNACPWLLTLKRGAIRNLSRTLAEIGPRYIRDILPYVLDTD